MNIYLLKQDINADYDTYDSCVVTANSEDEARRIHPDDYLKGEWWIPKGEYTNWGLQDWCLPEQVTVTLIGETNLINEAKVICASFNAG